MDKETREFLEQATRDHKTVVKHERTKVMARMRKEGFTLEQIAKAYDMTREGVRQVLNKLEADKKWVE